MKKGLIIIGLLLAFTGSGLFAKDLTGVGLYGNLIGSGSGAGGGLGLTFKFGNFPVLGVDYMLAQNAMNLGISCDWWIVNAGLTGALNYYLGLGGYLGFASAGSSTTFNPGARIPIGLQMYPVNHFEIFAEFAPMVTFIPSPELAYSLRLGFRIHF